MLITKLLIVDPKKRITAELALIDDYLKEKIPNEIKEKAKKDIQFLKVQLKRN